MPEYLGSNVQGCLVDQLVEHSQGNDVQKPRYQLSDLLHSSAVRALTVKGMPEYKGDDVQVCFIDQLVEHSQGNDAKSHGINLWNCFIVQLVEH